jgi:hypothetical protein
MSASKEDFVAELGLPFQNRPISVYMWQIAGRLRELTVEPKAPTNDADVSLLRKVMQRP